MWHFCESLSLLNEHLFFEGHLNHEFFFFFPPLWIVLPCTSVKCFSKPCRTVVNSSAFGIEFSVCHLVAV